MPHINSSKPPLYLRNVKFNGILEITTSAPDGNDLQVFPNNHVQRLMQFPDLYQQFLERSSSVPHLCALGSPQAVDVWIRSNCVGENLLPFAWNHPTIQIRHVVINSDLINADDVKKRELITDKHQHAMRTTRMTMREIFDCIPCAPGSENMRERNYLSLRCSQLAHITDYTVQDYDQCDVSLLMLSTMPRGDAVPPPKGRVVVLRDAVPAKYEKVCLM